MQEFYHDNQETGHAETSLSPDSAEYALERLRGIKSPSDIARLSGNDVQIYPKPEPVDPVTTESNQAMFLSLFPNRFASCIKRGKDGGWRMTSQFHHLSDEEIVEAISGQATFLRACMADVETRFVTILLEESSFYRSAEGLEKIRDCLRCLGINQFKLYTFEESEEWQLFAFFKRPVNSEKIAGQLSSWLRRNGIVPGTAGVRIFPGADPFCLPLQPGFTWINDNGQVIVCRNEVSSEAALALFIADLERSDTDGEEVLARLDQILS